MTPELLERMAELSQAGATYAVATVVRVEKPISARPGDKGVITADGSLHGWVGGGCAQDVVIHEAQKAMRAGEARFLRLVGGMPAQDAPAAPEAGVQVYPITCHSGGTLDVFIEPFLPRPQLVLIGSSPVAQTLARLARALHYEVRALGPEATREQFPDADEVSGALELGGAARQAGAFVVIATQGHDDETALEAAARSRAPYIAFVASRKKFASRAEFLRAQGVSEEQIARIKAPAGLDIGAVSAGEIAVSILAEIVQVRRSRAAPSAEAPAAADAPAEVAPREARDVVCGMTVEIAGARHFSDFGGVRYYFCAASCKAQFDREPTKYVAA